MPRKTPYTFGGELTESESAHVIKTLLPNKRKRRRVPTVRLLAGLHAYVPNALEHEVNRKRGIAFDSGEAGFSHQRISGE